jgi:hypothetical protein
MNRDETNEQLRRKKIQNGTKRRVLKRVPTELVAWREPFLKKQMLR